MSISQGFGFWVKRPNNSQRSASGFNGSEFYGASSDSNYGVWVDLPQIDVGVMSSFGSPDASPAQTQPPASDAATPRSKEQDVERRGFTQFTDVNSDIEYELRLFKGKSFSSKDTTYIANVIKINGRYEYFPDETKSYGFRFYNEHLDGFDYMNSFNASGIYKKYWGDMEAGCTFNVNFESGFSGGLIFGPTLHFLYKHYFGASKLSAGAFGSYSYCTLRMFGGWNRSFLSYGIIGAYSMPFSAKVAGSVDLYTSHEFLACGIQIPYYLTKSVQLIGGLKKVFVFQEWNLSNYVITIGASRRF
jgi:hypothetical protein